MLAQSNMNRLAEVLDELNMIEFHPVLNGAAYETWEDVLNITETDLVSLGIKTGYRRRLQRRMAQEHGVHEWQSIPFQQNGAVARPDVHVLKKVKVEHKHPTSSVQRSSVTTVESARSRSDVTQTRRTPRAPAPTRRQDNGRRLTMLGNLAVDNELVRQAALLSHYNFPGQAAQASTRPARNFAAGYLNGHTQRHASAASSPALFTTANQAGVPQRLPQQTASFAVPAQVQRSHAYSSRSPDTVPSPASQDSCPVTSSPVGSVDTFTSYGMSEAAFSNASNSASVLDLNGGHMADYEFSNNSIYGGQPVSQDFTYNLPQSAGMNLFSDDFLSAFGEAMMMPDEDMNDFVTTEMFGPTSELWRDWQMS